MIVKIIMNSVNKFTLKLVFLKYLKEVLYNCKKFIAPKINKKILS